MKRTTERDLNALGLHSTPVRRRGRSRIVGVTLALVVMAAGALVGGVYLWNSFAPHPFDTVRRDAISKSDRTRITLQPQSLTRATREQVAAWGPLGPVDQLGTAYIARVRIEAPIDTDPSPYRIIQNWALSGPRHEVGAIAPNLDDAEPEIAGCTVTGAALRDALRRDGEADFCLLFDVTGKFDRNQLVFSGFVQHITGRGGGYSDYDARWTLPDRIAR